MTAKHATADFERRWPLISVVPGWLSTDPAAALHSAAGRVETGQAIVEIGSYMGRSTVALGSGKASDVALLAVDPWGGDGGDAVLAAFRRNLDRAGLTSEVRLFRGTSEEAATQEGRLRELLDGAGSAAAGWIGLLFVDGLHDRDSVLGDIDRWEPLVATGGLVYFHDAFFRRGVTQAVLKRHLLNSRFRYLGSVSNLAMFRRERCGTAVTIASSLRLVLRLSYFARNVLTTVAIRRGWSWLVRLFPPEEDFEYGQGARHDPAAPAPAAHRERAASHRR
jgi:predicted O-methyltransferase YrrM